MGEAISRQELVARVETVRWYHSLHLPHGIVTPGSFDTADELARVPFPASLDGKRCLDVATSDGFWAFEMERRGAAEVVAIDVPPERMDWPGNASPKPSGFDASEEAPQRGFEIAHEALNSRVIRRELSAYELSPEVIGEFDFVFVGSVLLHLRDPVGALAGIARVLRGEVLSVDAVSLPLTVLHPGKPVARLDAPDWPLWWGPNLQAYRRYFGAARLQILAGGRPFFLKRGLAYCPAYGAAVTDTVPRFHRNPKRALAARIGNVHAWVRATAIR
jgi:tRNA (mo5U34)-methyltransferase